MTDTTSAAPSDAEIDALDDQFRWDTTQGRRDYARAVLARWGAPQPDMTVVIARAKQEAIAAYLSRFGDEPQPVARGPLSVAKIEAAAKALSACMDYPWAYMPEKGRQSMRKHAAAVIAAANGITGDGNE